MDIHIIHIFITKFGFFLAPGFIFCAGKKKEAENSASLFQSTKSKSFFSSTGIRSPPKPYNRYLRILSSSTPSIIVHAFRFVPPTLIGGATARIGDPSEKTLKKPELDIDTLEKNIVGISNVIRRILGGTQYMYLNANSYPDDSSLVILNNYDWWKEFSLLDLLKRVGRYARVGSMMAKESVRKRLESEQGMSYTKFTYQLLQGYDVLYLFQNEGVNVQIGDSDQWGNITAGTELIRKILQDEGAYGLTFPLLLKSDGTKFGKLEDGAIWLSPAFLSPYKFYQYFFSVPDADVIKFMKILTFLDIEEIKALERDMTKPGYLPNTIQRRLPEEVTQFVHGEDGLNEALKAT